MNKEELRKVVQKELDQIEESFKDECFRSGLNKDSGSDTKELYIRFDNEYYYCSVRFDFEYEIDSNYITTDGVTDLESTSMDLRITYKEIEEFDNMYNDSDTSEIELEIKKILGI